MSTAPGSATQGAGWRLPPLLPPLLHPPHTRPCPPPPGRAPGQALTGLVLGGGGARAAYQVGVLRALARLQRQALGPCLPLRNPFDVVVGTSAGAINAAALACRADQYEAAVQSLVDVWWHFQSHQVYRADAWGVVRTGTRWLTMLSLGWALRRWRRLGPQSLLDNAPLAELLDSLVPMDRLPGQLAAGHLQALAITASRYSTGEHVSFYSAAQAVRPWARSQRLALPAHLDRSHLMASSAIPFIFPPGQISHAGQSSWYGDGALRQTAPLSPAIHLGAERLLVIGVGRMAEPPSGANAAQERPPSLAQVGGHALSSIFLDALAVDVERMHRINRTLALLPEAQRRQTDLKPIEALVISPSQRLDDIAARHLAELPGPTATLLRAVGVGGVGGVGGAAAGGSGAARGAALASYLLFEAPFTRELMALGEADTLARRDEVQQFFGWQAPALGLADNAAHARPAPDRRPLGLPAQPAGHDPAGRLAQPVP